MPNSTIQDLWDKLQIKDPETFKQIRPTDCTINGQYVTDATYNLPQSSEGYKVIPIPQARLRRTLHHTKRITETEDWVLDTGEEITTLEALTTREMTRKTKLPNIKDWRIIAGNPGSCKDTHLNSKTYDTGIYSTGRMKMLPQQLKTYKALNTLSTTRRS